MRLEFEDVQTGSVHSVPPEGAVLGRERARTDIAFRDESISKRHARIFGRDGLWFLEDLDSSNGTYIRNERVFEPVRLRSGVEFVLAQRRFRVTSIVDGDDDTGEPPRGGSDGVLATFGGAFVELARTVPRLALSPAGAVQRSIEDPDPPGLGPLQLALHGGVAAACAAAWTPLFELAWSSERLGALARPAAAVGVAAAVGGLLGLAAQPVLSRGIHGLGGASDRDVRSRLARLFFALWVLAGLPVGVVRGLAPLGPVLVTAFGGAFALWVAGITLFSAFRWARALGVYRGVEIAVLVVGLSTIVGGSASAIRSLLDRADPGGVPGGERTEGLPTLTVPASVVGSSGTGGSTRPRRTPSAKAERVAGPAGEVFLGGSSERAASRASESAKLDEADAGVESDFRRYRRQRRWLEAAFDANPGLLRDAGIRAAYERLLAAEARADADEEAGANVAPWYEPHIARRLRAARRYERTNDRVTSLARRVRRALDADGP